MSVVSSQIRDHSVIVPPAALSRAWEAGSLAAVCSALICAAILLLSRRPEPRTSLLGTSLIALAIILVLLAPSIYLTQFAVHSAGGILGRRTRELNAVFESALDSIVVLDELGICRHANLAALKLLEVRPERLLGQPI